VTELLVDLRERGLNVTRPILRCSTVHRAAPRGAPCVRPPGPRWCRLHKIRNVEDKLQVVHGLVGHFIYNHLVVD